MYKRIFAELVHSLTRPTAHAKAWLARLRRTMKTNSKNCTYGDILKLWEHNDLMETIKIHKSPG